MTEDEFIFKHPELYHMAQETSWKNIESHGLLSTSALLDLFQIHGQDRVNVEESHRNNGYEINHLTHGTAYIRDQKPLRMSQLEKCLEGISITDWLKLLNGKVYLWPTAERVQTLSKARAYRNQTHCLIAVDTIGLLGKYSNDIRLAPINVGATLYNPPKRSPDIFSKIADFPNRKMTDKVAEVSVNYSIPDIKLIVNSVHLILDGKCIKRLQ